MTEEKQGFWAKVWQYIKAVANSLWKWLLRYPILIPITVLVILLAVAAALVGQKFQIGGILNTLWGKKKPDDNRAKPPEDRVDEGGKPIQPGESDKGGHVQAPVKTNIKSPGILSDPNEVVIIENKKEIKIPLPKGVKNSDVKEIIRISPRIYEIKNNDGGTSVYELDNLIDGLGG